MGMFCFKRRLISIYYCPMASKTQAYFECDPNFCASCGAILPLPDQSKYITCKGCGTMLDISGLEDIEIHSYKNFNQDKLKSSEEISRLKDLTEKSGPVVKRSCPQCNYKKMTYTTRQTRSADEGQTVFYLCLKCQFTETEYS